MLKSWDQSLGQEDSPGVGHVNPFHHSCLENPMDREAWRAMVHRLAKCWTRLSQLSMHAREPNLPDFLIFQSQEIHAFVVCLLDSISWSISSLTQTEVNQI